MLKVKKTREREKERKKQFDRNLGFRERAKRRKKRLAPSAILSDLSL